MWAPCSAAAEGSVAGDVASTACVATPGADTCAGGAPSMSPTGFSKEATARRVPPRMLRRLCFLRLPPAIPDTPRLPGNMERKLGRTAASATQSFPGPEYC